MTSTLFTRYIYTERIQNRTEISTFLSVYTKEEFRTVPKFARFCLFTRKKNLEPYQNLHVSVCLHERRIQNRTKICTFLSVYTKEEFRTVPKFTRFCLFTRKKNSEPYRNQCTKEEFGKSIKKCSLYLFKELH